MADIEARFRVDRPGFSLDVDLRLSGRGVTALFGQSGAGKTTLIRCMAGLEQVPEGRLVVNGEVWQDKGRWLPTHKRHVGYVFQEASLLTHLSVLGNLQYGMRRVTDTGRINLNQAIELLDIPHLLGRKPDRLSGGERQRVALARALLASPQLLLLDEPLAALDARLKSQILPFLRRVKDEINIPMIYVSHSIREIQALADEVAVIEGGRVLACGPYREVMTGMAGTPLTHALGVDNLLPLTITQSNPTSGHAVAMVGEHSLMLPAPALAVGDQVTAVIPAAAIALATTLLSGITIQNQLPGHITQIRLLGHRALVTVDVGVALVVEVTEKAVRDLQLGEGQHVVCLIKAQSISLLGQD